MFCKIWPAANVWVSTWTRLYDSSSTGKQRKVLYVEMKSIICVDIKTNISIKYTSDRHRLNFTQAATMKRLRRGSTSWVLFLLCLGIHGLTWHRSNCRRSYRTFAESEALCPCVRRQQNSHHNRATTKVGDEGCESAQSTDACSPPTHTSPSTANSANAFRVQSGEVLSSKL